MMNLNSIVKAAKQEALKSKDRHKIGAIIFGKKVIVSKGHNCKERSVKSLLPLFQKREHSVHAEVSSIILARKSVRGLSMLVVRVNNQGKLRLAKPCSVCMTYIRYVKIKNVYYSTNDGTIERIKL